MDEGTPLQPHSFFVHQMDKFPRLFMYNNGFTVRSGDDNIWSEKPLLIINVE